MNTERSVANRGRDVRTSRLKQLIRDLHDGLPADQARARFDALVRDVSPEEIGAMEEQLIREGMPVREIQRLCDVHVSVVKGGLERQVEASPDPGHPAHTYMEENRIILDLAEELGAVASRLGEEAETPDPAENQADMPSVAATDPANPTYRRIAEILERLGGVDNHYLRKENQLFPYLERHGITGPSQVMWGVHDDIRKQLKGTRLSLETVLAGAENLSLPEIEARPSVISAARRALVQRSASLSRSLMEMVYKENKILLPLALRTLTPEEWDEVRRGEDELGYVLVQPSQSLLEPPHTPLQPAQAPLEPARPGVRSDPAPATPAPEPRTPTSQFSLPVVPHDPTPANTEAPLPALGTGHGAPGHATERVSADPGTGHVSPEPESGTLAFDLGTGRLSLEQVDMILRHLPVDISFVDASGHVRYYSDTEERIFPRTPAAIGRHVENCHPPKSVHMVKEILRAFEAGERDVAEFWIELEGKFIHIRYFAVRNPEGEFLGTLEMGQDVTKIRGLEGQRRLLEWD